ncbi:hypothetical protein [Microbacterium paludicola]|uniref:hypothetical protein n=1 Tax=Microbacterium paludicola TaxID=300019 RepID=UPI0009034388|nr:hypothetical protein [Microbacterium paludicola]APF33966.1 hypothetical protein BO218_07025 [Microbacterium paludicola]
MIDFGEADPDLLQGLSVVIEELSSRVGLDADRVLVLGADCRDLIHSSLGFTFALRATTDTDIAIAVSDWEIYDRIEATYRRLGSNGIRYSIAEIPVDIMPFGGVESPDGISAPRARGAELVVFGFSDVYERSARLRLPSGLEVRVPEPAGYVALKLRAWLDRAPYGEDKDARDLALATHWYSESATIADRLYETEEGLALLVEADWDRDLAAVSFLARDAGQQLSESNRRDLAARLSSASPRALAQSFVLPSSSRIVISFDRRVALATRLMEIGP